VSKQNVLYYLKKAIHEFPELETVIKVDTRFSSGNYALKTLAVKRLQEVADARLRENLYDQSQYRPYRLSIKEINDICRTPFNIPKEMFDFNPYIDDERHLKEAAGEKA